MDTLKLANGDLTVSRNVDRTHLWAVQTPQAFRREIILEAMNAVRDQNAAVTDDTAACELIGQEVALVASHALNPRYHSGRFTFGRVPAQPITSPCHLRPIPRLK